MKSKKFIKLLSGCGFTNNNNSIERCLEIDKNLFTYQNLIFKSDFLDCKLKFNKSFSQLNDVYYYGTLEDLTLFRDSLMGENIITSQIDNVIRLFNNGEADSDVYESVMVFTQSQLEVFLKHVLLKTKVATIQKFVDGQNLSTNNVYFSNGNKNAVIDLAEFDGFPLQISLSKNNKNVKQILWNYEIQPLGNIPKDIEGFFDYIKTAVNVFGVK